MRAALFLPFRTEAEEKFRSHWLRYELGLWISATSRMANLHNNVHALVSHKTVADPGAKFHLIAKKISKLLCNKFDGMIRLMISYFTITNRSRFLSQKTNKRKAEEIRLSLNVSCISCTSVSLFRVQVP